MSKGGAKKRAYSMAEIVIAVTILAAALIPIYSTFISGSKAVSSSRLAYMAAQVARETIEELRQIPFDKLEELASTDRQPVAGKLFQRTCKYRSKDDLSEDPKAVLPATPSYPAEYQRIKTTIKVQNITDNDRLKRVILQVVWEETGGVREKSRPAMTTYTTLIGYHSVDPEVYDEHSP